MMEGVLPIKILYRATKTHPAEQYDSTLPYTKEGLRIGIGHNNGRDPKVQKMHDLLFLRRFNIKDNEVFVTTLDEFDDLNKIASRVFRIEKVLFNRVEAGAIFRQIKVQK